MVLHLHRAPRTDLLADALGELLSTPAGRPVRPGGRRGAGQGRRAVADPAALAPARHRRRAAATGSARGCGSCSPARWSRCCSAASGTTPGTPTGWCGRCSRPSTRASASRGAPRCRATSATASSGEAGELRRNRRYSVAIRLARLFASYAVQRPQLVTDWREGRDTDGAGSPLPDDLAWQAELWRRLLARIPEDPPDVRHRRTLERLDGRRRRARPARPAVAVRPHPAAGHRGRAARGARPAPRRPPLAAAALAGAVGGARATSTAWWPATTTPRPTGSATRCSPRSAATPASCAARSRTGGFPDGRGGRRCPQDEPATLLGWLQHDLRANHAPTVAGAVAPRTSSRTTAASRCTPATAPPARSTCCARCWSGCSQDDPTLEPRDILVMCPDIETYAPLVSAGFGLAPTDGARRQVGHPAHLLRVRLADRALTSTNPLLQLAGRLLELSGGRVTASDVLDLAAGEPCRRRFGFTDDDLDRLGRWVAGTDVRWGLDAASRQRVRHGPLPQQHLALRARPGAARRRDERRRPPAPRPRAAARRRRQQRDRPGRPAGRAARPARRAAWPGWSPRPRSTEWMDALRDGVRDLAEVAGDDAWQLPQLERELARAAASSTAGGPELRLADVRALLELAAGRSSHPGQLPHRHADGLHDGADAVGAAPGGLPGRPRRRGLPAPRHRRRRRRPGPPAAHRRARPAQRGPPAVPRRAAGRDRARRHHLHRRQRAAPAPAGLPPYPSASCSTPPTAPPPSRCARRS